MTPMYKLHTITKDDMAKTKFVYEISKDKDFILKNKLYVIVCG